MTTLWAHEETNIFETLSLPHLRSSGFLIWLKSIGGRALYRNKDSELIASQLFYGLSTADDQLALFKVYGIHDNLVLQKDLVVVINHLHTTVANVDPEVDNTQLLQTMLDALMNVKDDPVANSLRNELNAWIAARRSVREDYVGASANYAVALSFNPNNHALLYERAKVYVALKLYANALQDLDATLESAKQSAPNIPTPAPTSVPTDTFVPIQLTSVPNTAKAPNGCATKCNKVSHRRSNVASHGIHYNT